MESKAAGLGCLPKDYIEDQVNKLAATSGGPWAFFITEDAVEDMGMTHGEVVDMLLASAHGRFAARIEVAMGNITIHKD